MHRKSLKILQISSFPVILTGVVCAGATVTGVVTGVGVLGLALISVHT
jgi:NAD/NADP transhydrogenase alpha subunit